MLDEAHKAMGDAHATATLLRFLLERDLAPESARLDREAFMRLRTRGDIRPASEPQIRRVFGMARSAGLLHPDGGVDRDQVVALVERVTGTADVDGLTRAQVQDVYDTLDLLIRIEQPGARARRGSANVAA